MGAMKHYLDEKIEEFAKSRGVTAQEVYTSDELYAEATTFAQTILRSEADHFHKGMRKDLQGGKRRL